MKVVASYAIWCSGISTVSILCLMALVLHLPLPTLLAAFALVSVGGAVVGALIGLSFSDQGEH